jgi:hypothetical protein
MFQFADGWSRRAKHLAGSICLEASTGKREQPVGSNFAPDCQFGKSPALLAYAPGWSYL